MLRQSMIAGAAALVAYVGAVAAAYAADPDARWPQPGAAVAPAPTAAEVVPIYLTFYEPSQGAYALELPSGWGPQSRTYTAFGLAFAGLTVRAPDNSVLLLLGTIDPIVYAEPSAAHSAGTILQSEGVAVTVAESPTPAGAIGDHLGTLLGDFCAGATILASRPRMADPNLPAGGSMAEVVFACSGASGPMLGQIAASLVPARDSGLGPIWVVERLYGFAATEPMVATAVAAVSHANATFWPFADEAPEHQYAAAPVIDSTAAFTGLEDGDATDALLEMRQQDQSAQFLSDMMLMEHQSNMMIFYNMGNGWTYE